MNMYTFFIACIFGFSGVALFPLWFPEALKVKFSGDWPTFIALLGGAGIIGSVVFLSIFLKKGRNKLENICVSIARYLFPISLFLFLTGYVVIRIRFPEAFRPRLVFGLLLGYPSMTLCGILIAFFFLYAYLLLNAPTIRGYLKYIAQWSGHLWTVIQDHNKSKKWWQHISKHQAFYLPLSLWIFFTLIFGYAKTTPQEMEGILQTVSTPGVIFETGLFFGMITSHLVFPGVSSETNALILNLLVSAGYAILLFRLFMLTHPGVRRITILFTWLLLLLHQLSPLRWVFIDPTLNGSLTLLILVIILMLIMDRTSTRRSWRRIPAFYITFFIGGIQHLLFFSLLIPFQLLIIHNKTRHLQREGYANPPWESLSAVLGLITAVWIRMVLTNGLLPNMPPLLDAAAIQDRTFLAPVMAFISLFTAFILVKMGNMLEPRSIPTEIPNRYDLVFISGLWLALATLSSSTLEWEYGLILPLVAISMLPEVDRFLRLRSAWFLAFSVALICICQRILLPLTPPQLLLAVTNSDDRTLWINLLSNLSQQSYWVDTTTTTDLGKLFLLSLLMGMVFFCARFIEWGYPFLRASVIDQWSKKTRRSEIKDESLLQDP